MIIVIVAIGVVADDAAGGGRRLTKSATAIPQKSYPSLNQK